MCQVHPIKDDLLVPLRGHIPCVIVVRYCSTETSQLLPFPSFFFYSKINTDCIIFVIFPFLQPDSGLGEESSSFWSKLSGLCRRKGRGTPQDSGETGKQITKQKEEPISLSELKG